MTLARAGVHASKAQIITAFVGIYLIWGSTYLAIRFAVATLPPFLMMGTRFLIGGVLFYILSRVRKEPGASRTQISWAVLIGVIMLCGATGVVGWAEQLVPSALTALIISGSPYWFVLIDWLRPNGVRPSKATIAGLAVGIIGIIILIGPDKLHSGGAVNLVGAGALICSSIMWSLGSITSQHVNLPKSQILTSGYELLAGAIGCLIIGTVSGEWSQLAWETVSLKSVLAMGYLSIFGAVAFLAFVFLLKVSTPAKVSTYAYINPVVAVVLGATLGGEEFTLRMAIASVVIIGAVVVITTAKMRKAEEATEVSPVIASEAEAS